MSAAMIFAVFRTYWPGLSRVHWCAFTGTCTKRLAVCERRPLKRAIARVAMALGRSAVRLSAIVFAACSAFLGNPSHDGAY